LKTILFVLGKQSGRIRGGAVGISSRIKAHEANRINQYQNLLKRTE
jgi:hypothetical protein